MRKAQPFTYALLAGSLLTAAAAASVHGIIRSPRRSAAPVAVATPATRAAAPAAPALPHPAAATAPPRVLEETLLDETGRLRRAVPVGEAIGWKWMLGRNQLTSRQNAWLHVWCDEYELAHNEEPDHALWHFRQA